VREYANSIERHLFHPCWPPIRHGASSRSASASRLTV